MSHRWTPEQIEALRRLYPDFEASVVAKVIGRSTRSVHQMAGKLGLSKSEAFQAAYRERQAMRARADPRVRQNQFPKGLQPWNKGKAGSTGTHPNCRAHQFKPGNAPHTTLPLGSYRINTDGHLQQKVSAESGNNSKRWRNVAELVWCAAHGPVPPKHIVVFKPGMGTNRLELITLDRVECISLAENMRRNSWRTRYPELASLVQLKGAVARQVNRINRSAREAMEKAA